MFDSHCHLNFPELKDTLVSDINQCISAGIHQWMVPGTSLSSLTEFQELTTLTSNFLLTPAEVHLNLYFSLGLHPYFIQQHKKNDILLLETQIIETQTSTFKIQAIGEAGLDATCENHPLQIFLLERHFELANTFNLPIILHHRKSLPDLLKIAKRFPSVKGVIHAFSGSYEQAKQWVDLGYYLGVGGTITYERAIKTKQALQRIDLKHLLIETDAPSMPISGKQGYINNPINLIEVAKSLAGLKSVPLDDVDHQCTINAQTLFGKI